MDVIQLNLLKQFLFNILKNLIDLIIRINLKNLQQQIAKKPNSKLEIGLSQSIKIFQTTWVGLILFLKSLLGIVFFNMWSP